MPRASRSGKSAGAFKLAVCCVIETDASYCKSGRFLCQLRPSFGRAAAGAAWTPASAAAFFPLLVYALFLLWCGLPLSAKKTNVSAWKTVDCALSPKPTFLRSTSRCSVMRCCSCCLCTESAALRCYTKSNEQRQKCKGSCSPPLQDHGFPFQAPTDRSDAAAPDLLTLLRNQQIPGASSNGCSWGTLGVCCCALRLKAFRSSSNHQLHGRGFLWPLLLTGVWHQLPPPLPYRLQDRCCVHREI